MSLTDQDIDDYEEMVAESADKECSAYRRLLGIQEEPES